VEVLCVPVSEMAGTMWGVYPSSFVLGNQSSPCEPAETSSKYCVCEWAEYQGGCLTPTRPSHWLPLPF